MAGERSCSDAAPALAGGPAPLADVLIVGGGIVGLATAWRLASHEPRRRVIVIEKEPRLAAHQTGHNSGVIHSGIYYRPGSQKALNCCTGKRLLEHFCREHHVPFEICGKVILATGADELPRLEALLERGRANGVPCERIGPERLREIEPHATAIAAIHVPGTGIADFAAITRKLADLVREAGGEVHLSTRLTGVRRDGPGIRAVTNRGDFPARLLVNCAGLHSDRVTRMTGTTPPARIIPFRGEYHELVPAARRLVRNLIYPVPDPAFPFLGVHFTRMIDRDEHGHRVECGPNALLAMHREGYTRMKLSPGELAATLSSPGFWRMSRRYWRTGLGEMWRSFSRRALARALQRLVPEITAGDLKPAPAGVRAQALAPDGQLLDDFVIAETDRAINVINAPSPAATASLAIGREIARLAASRLP